MITDQIDQASEAVHERPSRKSSTGEEARIQPSGEQKSLQPAEAARAQPEVSADTGRHKRGSRAKVAIIALVALVVLAALFLLGLEPRIKRKRELGNAANQEKQSVPNVNVIKAQGAPSSTQLELPGNIEALQVASISARTSGYLKRLYVDIGDRVRAGQLLAVIDAPEVQQEIEQARGTLNQARAALGQTQATLQQARTNAEYARVTYERYHYLVGQGVVSKQDADDRQAAYEVAKAGVTAQLANVNASQAVISSNEANVRRLIELQGYQRLYAPFNGVVTARYVDNGSLIGGGSSSSSSSATSVGNSSGSTPDASAAGAGGPATGSTAGGQGSGGALYSIAKIDTLCIYVNVPQALVESLHPGQPTEIAVRELPSCKFEGRVQRTAEALDPATRTLLTEVQIRNTDYSLLPGMYAQVKFDVALSEHPVRIPAVALIVDSRGTRVATVTSDQKIHLQDVTVGRDYGKSLDIVSGLEEGALLVIDPTAALEEGMRVQVNQVQNQPENQNQQGQAIKG